MSIAVAEEKKTKVSQLDQLKKFTKVVADTADFESIKDFKPQDATTNPSLVYAATQKQQYGHLLEEVLADRKKSGLSGHEQIEDICDHLLVQFGCDILETSTSRHRPATSCPAIVAQAPALLRQRPRPLVRPRVERQKRVE